MTALTKQSFIPTMQEMQQLIEVSKILSSAPFYAKMGPGGVLAIYMTAKELNLPPMMCLNGGMYTFSGKVTLSAQMMQVLITNAGCRVELMRLDLTMCHIRFHWKGRKYDYTFTMEEAHRAGYLTKDNWIKHPKDMLYNRTMAGGARKYMPEVLLGCYVVGEMEGDTIPIEPFVESIIEENKIMQVDECATIDTEGMTKIVGGVWNAEKQAIVDVEKKHEDFDIFCELHGIKEGTDIMTYVETVAHESKRSITNIINSAIKNPERFDTGFQKWYANLPQTEEKEESGG